MPGITMRLIPKYFFRVTACRDNFLLASSTSSEMKRVRISCGDVENILRQPGPRERACHPGLEPHGERQCSCLRRVEYHEPLRLAERTTARIAASASRACLPGERLFRYSQIASESLARMPHAAGAPWPMATTTPIRFRARAGAAECTPPRREYPRGASAVRVAVTLTSSAYCR